MNNKRFKILGVPVDNMSFGEISKIITKKIVSQAHSPIFISTINASFIVKASTDIKFNEILNCHTDINTCDGISIQMAGDYIKKVKGRNFIKNFILGFKIGILKHFNPYNKYEVFPERITGIAITKFILDLANSKKLNILIVNRPDGLTKKISILNFLKSNYPQIRTTFIETHNYKQKLKNNYNCDIFFCLLGEGKQEHFIINNKNNIKYRVAIGVGSSFDVLTGTIKPIPEFIKKIGFEWLFRLIYNPKRIKKIFISVCYFPYLVYMSSLSQK